VELQSAMAHCPLTGWQVDGYGDPDGMITERRRLKYSEEKCLVSLSPGRAE
jgi:hypothetical protein